MQLRYITDIVMPCLLFSPPARFVTGCTYLKALCDCCLQWFLLSQSLLHTYNNYINLHDLFHAAMLMMEDKSLEKTAQLEHLKPQEVLRIQLEKLWRIGELGYTTNFSTFEEIVTNYSSATELDEDSSRRGPENEDDVIAAMHSIHHALSQLQQDERLLRDNKPIVSEVESAVDRILSSLGKSDRWIGGQNFRTKLKQIIEMRTPQPPPNFVTVFMVDPLTNPDTNIDQTLKQINIPLSATLYQVHKLLRQVVKGDSLSRCNETGEDPRIWDRAEVVWKYQLMAKDRSKLLNQTSIKLETDSDLKRMYRTIRNVSQGSNSPDAVLTCVRFNTQL